MARRSVKKKKESEKRTWRKVTNTNDWWTNGKVNVRVVRIPQFLGRHEYLYNVRVEESFGKKYKIIARDIPRKRDAVRIAKEWMKKHPNGIKF